MIQKKFFSILFMASLLVACNNDDSEKVGGNPDGVKTYVNLSISLPSLKNQLRALPDDYNPDGTYEGNDYIQTLDIYLKSSDGTTESRRFTNAQLAILGTTVTPSEPFTTTAGTKTIYVVVNSPSAPSTTVDEDALLPMAGLAQISNIGGTDYDVITMTGKTPGTVTINADVTQQDVIDGTANNFDVSVTRVASRAIVTISTAANLTIENTEGITIGTLSNLNYSVAQGTNQVYWQGRTDFSTWGSSYVPADNSDYIAQAETYYDYSDLSTPDAIPTNPNTADGYKSLPGKFLFENTHPTSSQYVKGNTAYILVRATFTPEASAITDGGTLTDGTFYVGKSNGLIYSSKEAARDPNSGGIANQQVATYVNGKMLNYAWLNPDDIQTPKSSPVVRNNIYHVNITGFSQLGTNWNPLYPEEPDTSNPENPDPNPDTDDPEPPVDPTDPLSPEETYMNVEITVLDWTVHSYDIDF